MRVAINEHNQQVLAADRNRAYTYKCLCCKADVVLKAGNVKVPHFSHKSLLDCEYSTEAGKANKMSDFHRDIQEAFFALGAELEVKYPNNRADVVYEGVVYEIQNSKISYTEVRKRNEVYGKVRWIVNQENVKLDMFPNDKLVCMVNQWKNVVTLHFKKLEIVFGYTDYKSLVTLVSNTTVIKSAFEAVQAKRADESKREQQYKKEADERVNKINDRYLAEQAAAKFRAEKSVLNAMVRDKQAASIPNATITTTPITESKSSAEIEELAVIAFGHLRQETPKYLAMSTAYPFHLDIRAWWSEYCKATKVFADTHKVSIPKIDDDNIQKLYSRWKNKQR